MTAPGGHVILYVILALPILFSSIWVEADIIEEVTPEEQKELQKEEDAKNITEILMRPHLNMGHPQDPDWDDTATKDRSSLKKGSAGVFRNSAVKVRGSKVKIQKRVVPYPHRPTPTEPKGCGNPVCVILDKKPMRFTSVCQLVRSLITNNRRNQVNFIQKGDCYDIIDNNNGAAKKPWVDEKEDLSDCDACSKDDTCKHSVTINIDLKNLLYGESSAFGGESFNEATAQRMVGVPMDFKNICQMMRFFKNYKNINFNTQVVGFSLGQVSDIYPDRDESESCLWTEWFDYDTPCNSDGDTESHEEHFLSLQDTWTGSLRICKPKYLVSTEHYGGSEITTVDAREAKAGTATGFTGKAFKQNIYISNQKLECNDENQEIMKLPPPYIFGEGIRGKNKKNATCLDYKARYCCKATALFRPMKIGYFEATIPFFLPIGIIQGSIKLDDSGLITHVNVQLTSLYGSSDVVKIILIVAKLQQGKDKSSFKGEVNGDVVCANSFLVSGEVSLIRKPDMSGTIQIRLKRKIIESFALIKIHYSSDARVTALQTKDVRGVQIFTKIEETKTMTAVRYEGQKMELVYEGQKEISRKGDLNLDIGGSSKTNIVERLNNLCSDMQITMFIDSPPVALLFAECTWMDWISQEYPDKYRTGAEWEMRMETAKIPKYRKHVCSKVRDKAMYIDAVTVEDQRPWYDLQVNGQPYETYKVNPFHGYICNDQNMPNEKKFCKDMKVRYCCMKSVRAQWSNWGAWSECSQTCDGGFKTRRKTCKQMEKKLDTLEYNSRCAGMESKATEEILSVQKVSCGVEECPSDHKMTPWSHWTSCGKSCGNGTKERVRDCMPAMNGGRPCPDKLKENEKYKQTVPCTLRDCDIYYAGQWSSWTQCSATCGLGRQCKTRHCFSQQTKRQVSDASCTVAEMKSYFEQCKTCKLEDCPVNGGWSRWSEWSSCSQNCITFPADGKTVETKAVRTRRRSCSRPPPAFKGKDCPRSDKYEWVSHLKEEVDSTACITELSKDTSGKVEVTPWCPENCIFTPWGSWSACSETCVHHRGEIPFNGNSKKGTRNNKFNFGKTWEILYPTPPSAMPKRQRLREVFKEPRFNGTCPEMFEPFQNLVNKSSKSPKVWISTEDCKLCKEHCVQVDVKKRRELVDWPELPYPGDDASCVGYCPVDCRWGEETVLRDCKLEIEEYIDQLRKDVENFQSDNNKMLMQKFAIDSSCYHSNLYEKLYYHGFEDEAEAYAEEMNQHLENIKDVTMPVPEYLNEVKTLRELMKRKDEVQDIRREINSLFMDDAEKLPELIMDEGKREAIRPVLDGLFGGKPCFRQWRDKRQLTVRKDDDPKYDSKKMWNKVPEDRYLDKVCGIKMCIVKHDEKGTEGAITGECKTYDWSRWGEWTQCDKECEEEGRRKKFRKCVSTCDDKEQPSENCKPYFSNIYNKSFTDMDFTRCSPCPVEELSFWSEWSQPQVVANQGKLCGSGMIKQEIRRKCVGGKVQKCEGDDKKIIDIPAPACEGETYPSEGGGGGIEAEGQPNGGGMEANGEPNGGGMEANGEPNGGGIEAEGEPNEGGMVAEGQYNEGGMVAEGEYNGGGMDAEGQDDGGRIYANESNEDEEVVVEEGGMEVQ